MGKDKKKNMFSSEQIENSMEQIFRMISSKDCTEQRKVIVLCGQLWEQNNKSQSDNIAKSKKILVGIAQGRYENFDKDNTIYARNVLWSCLQNYAYKIIHRDAPTYLSTNNPLENKDNMTAMIHTCYIEMVNDLPNYNPDKGAPITHFSSSFQHAVAEWKKNSIGKGSKPALNADIRKVKNGQKRVRDNGGDENDVVALAAEIPSMNYEKIASTLNAIQILENMQSMDNSEEMCQCAGKEIWEPEFAAIKNENKEIFYKALHSLPDMEKSIYCLKNGVDIRTDSVCHKPMSDSDVANELGIPVDRVKAGEHRANNAIYTFISGKKRNVRSVASYQEEGDISEHRIRFLSDGDDAVDSEIDSVIEINVNIEASDVEGPPIIFGTTPESDKK